VGIVFDRRDVAVPELPGDRVSFWCADVAALPFGDAAFDGALSLNILDCVGSPVGHLAELGRVLAPRARALLATPYDWSPAATTLAEWLGGHSQRGPARGSSAAELRRVLSRDAAAGVDTGLVVVSERDGVPWRVYTNERASMDYAVDLLCLERKG
jgi:SAM-dependent methyltransferase